MSEDHVVYFVLVGKTNGIYSIFLYPLVKYVKRNYFKQSLSLIEFVLYSHTLKIQNPLKPW